MFFFGHFPSFSLPIGQVLQSEAPGAGGDPWQRPAALPRGGERPGRAALRRRSGRGGGIAGAAECAGGEQRLGGEMERWIFTGGHWDGRDFKGMDWE